jgi:hypothetical protein
MMGGGGGGDRSMNSLTQGMQTPDSKTAQGQLAIFKEQQGRSDYHTAGEAGAAREAELQTRVKRGATPLQNLLSPTGSAGLQVPV